MKNNINLILEGAKQLGILISQEQASKLLRYLEELKQWNTKMNLTAIRDDRGIIIRHFLDSLAVIEALAGPGFNSSSPLGSESAVGTWLGAPSRVMDVGTGAGFPGLPIKICRPQIFLTLVESRRKKVAFLHSLCGYLELKGVEILAERLEAIVEKPIHRGAYDVVMARGLNPAMVLGQVSTLLRPGGRLVIWAGSRGRDLSREMLGQPVWDRSEAISYRLPYEELKRNLIVMTKAFRDP